MLHFFITLYLVKSLVVMNVKALQTNINSDAAACMYGI